MTREMSASLGLLRSQMNQSQVLLSSQLYKRRPALGSLIELNNIKMSLSIRPAVKMAHLSLVDTEDTALFYYSDIVRKKHPILMGRIELEVK